MAAASPRWWGRGALSRFAVALLRSLAAAILGWRAGRTARGTKWRRRRATISRPRGRGTWDAKNSVLQGFCPTFRLRQDHILDPEKMGI